MWKVFDEWFSHLPASIRHSATMVLLGIFLTTAYFIADGRVRAAETTAKEAKDLASKTEQKVDKLADRINDLAGIVSMTNASVAIQAQQIQNTQQNNQALDKRLDRIEDKLDKAIKGR